MLRIGTTAITLMLFASPAFAHAIRMRVEVTDTHVQATVRYDGADEDGGPVTFTLSGREPDRDVAKLKPGTEPTVTFSRPEPGLYRIVAQDDFGHRVQVDFEVPPLGQNVSAGSVAPPGNWPVLAGIGIISVLAVAGWWLTGRKKSHGA